MAALLAPLLRYVRKLTLDPQGMVAADIAALREAGANDGEILEANQVCAYFNYSNNYFLMRLSAISWLIAY